MKTPTFLLSQTFSVGAMISTCLFLVSEHAEAKGPKGDSHDQGHSWKKQKPQKYKQSDSDRQAYTSRPRSTFTLSFGNGYAGSGYYYGPPNSPYYYQRSDVRYYSSREAAPREYYGREGSTDVMVQRELARRGYYRGSIDGAIGPQSRRAIATYQQDQGMRPTGDITTTLLRSLGL